MTEQIEMTNVGDMKLPEIAEQSKQVLAQAKAILVMNDDDYKTATEFCQLCREAINRIEKQRNILKAPVLEAGRMIDAKARELSANFEEAMHIVQEEANTYRRMMEAALVKAQEAARRAAVEEQKRIQEELVKKEAEIQDVESHEERILKEAEVVKLKNESKAVATVVPIPKVVKSNAGVSERKTLTGNVVDPLKLLKFVAARIDDNPEFQDFFKVNNTAINNYIKMTKGGKKLDGVEIVEKVTLVTRAKRK